MSWFGTEPSAASVFLLFCLLLFLPPAPFSLSSVSFFYFCLIFFLLLSHFSFSISFFFFSYLLFLLPSPFLFPLPPFSCIQLYSHLTYIFTRMELLYMDRRHISIYCCVQCSHNASPTTFGSGWLGHKRSLMHFKCNKTSTLMWQSNHTKKTFYCLE